jgi:hypothetical protein
MNLLIGFGLVLAAAVIVEGFITWNWWHILIAWFGANVIIVGALARAAALNEKMRREGLRRYL